MGMYNKNNCTEFSYDLDNDHCSIAKSVISCTNTGHQAGRKAAAATSGSVPPVLPGRGRDPATRDPTGMTGLTAETAGKLETAAAGRGLHLGTGVAMSDHPGEVKQRTGGAAANRGSCSDIWQQPSNVWVFGESGVRKQV
ncbi:UNVERIFIED_CONTAM: hypothetical protein FKN15_037378 [Acipenser sinensis]